MTLVIQVMAVAKKCGGCKLVKKIILSNSIGLPTTIHISTNKQTKNKTKQTDSPLRNKNNTLSQK